MDYDVIILGGGSAGLQAARSIAEIAGQLSVLLIEEDAQVGFPEHCTGLVSLSGIEKALRLNPEQVAMNYVRGAHIVSPSGFRLTVEKEARVAAVVDRPLYEQKLFDIVSRRADVVLGVKAEIDGVSVKIGTKRLRARYLVDARGLRSLVSRKPDARRWVLPALQYDIQVYSAETDYVYIFLGSKLSHGFFAWAVPLDEERYRIGVASKGMVLTRIRYLLRRLERLTDGEVRPRALRKVIGGGVYTGGLADQVKGNVFYIGDSAGQTKPTTGGGLVYHSTAALLLAKALKACEPRAYSAGVKRALGMEISGQRFLRRVLNRIPDGQLDYILMSVKEIGGEEIISRHGHMDEQMRVMLNLGWEILRKRPELYLSILRSLFYAIVS
ncbi:NAD(P)/FAD-dependent oxidoreductase [Infirmifilum sp. NZ]|uniref:NAD(P)/FAD-dependent oxidoreductase n=1 Tax=Infirmifilum sp. NZ TaxID=2926850 RepID=UPI00279DB8A7|nr:NAD(P)/FAD-dependent oxidoreductase [Infirmifilum sp. NZ]UNQ72857.1 NAD(P)/FAD-dependent oxidoreductase [Infirmifilum sp. NZ]